MGIGLMIGGGLLGAAAGAMGGDSKQISEQSLILDDPTALENMANRAQTGAFRDFQSFVEAGPGEGAVRAGTSAQMSLANLIQQFQRTSGLPGAGAVRQSQAFAESAFAPQQEALDQSFEDQTQAAARRAAISGRSINDPVLAAKLGQEQTRQQAMLDAQQGAFGTQLALDAPNREISLASARADVLGGLATQALANRQNLLSLGNTLRQQERQFRLQTATKRNVQSTEVGIGDRISGAISGGLSGMGAGLGLAGGLKNFNQGGGGNLFSSFFGGGGNGGGMAGGGQAGLGRVAPAPILPPNNPGPQGIPLHPSQVDPYSGPTNIGVGNWGFRNLNLGR